VFEQKIQSPFGYWHYAITSIFCTQMELHQTLITLIEQISQWSGITTHPHRFGGTEFRWHQPEKEYHAKHLLGKEIGHVHEFGVLDILFTKALREQLVTEGKVRKHHYVPDSGWTSYHLRSSDALQHALWLLTLSQIFQEFCATKNADRASQRLAELGASAEVETLMLSRRLPRPSQTIAHAATKAIEPSDSRFVDIP
jgi:hypothetical protein